MDKWRTAKNAVLSLLGLGVIWIMVVPVPLRVADLRYEPFPMTMGSLRFMGWIPIIFGAGVILWCYGLFIFVGDGTPWPIDPPRRLVVIGPYRVVRNPMESSALLILLGESFLLEASILLLYLVAGYVLLYLRQVLEEEPALRRRFGEPYEQYCKSVPRYVPLLGAGK
jgi:protein-S-isoprenylcysteine O-methyltransferase Ste14